MGLKSNFRKSAENLLQKNKMYFSFFFVCGKTKLTATSLSKIPLFQPSNSQDLTSNSPYCLPYSSCAVNLENLVLDQLIIP